MEHKINFRHDFYGNEFESMGLNDFVQALKSGKNSYYEHTGSEDEIACIYFDYDEYVSEEKWNKMNEQSDEHDLKYVYEEYENRIINNIKKYLPNKNNEYAQTRCHRFYTKANEYKFSLRLNFYNLHGAKSELKKMVEYIVSKHPEYKGGILDTGVYDNNKKIRCCNTAKPNESKPLELVKGTIAQTLIQYWKFNNKCEYLLWEEFAELNNIVMPDDVDTDNESVFTTDTQSFDVEIVKKETSDMNDIEKKLYVLQNCFQQGQYNKWFKIGCILRSICKYEEGLKYFVNASSIEPFNTEKEKQNTINVFSKIKPNSKYSMKSLDIMCENENNALYEEICITVVNGGDNEAAQIIYNEIKNKFVYSAGKFWYKLNNKWYNNEKEVKAIVKNYILNRNLVKSRENDKGKVSYQLYSSFNNHAKNILDVLCGKCIEYKDDKFSDKFIKTTKNKICFNNGVLNFETKEFKPWEQSQDVFTTIIIDYDYNPNRNESDISDVLNNVFISIFGDDHKRALHFFVRGITGNIQDKAWGLFLGSRNCGKGVNECLFKNTFEDYITSISSDLFINKGKNTGDDLKLWGWIQDVEASRLCFIQESKTDETDKYLKLDGVMFKKISSGGDKIQNRKNFQDPINSYIQTTFMLNANDIPPFTVNDCMETCSTFSSAKQFKSEEFINEKIANNASETELSLYFKRDDEIKDKCKKMEWRQALVHIMLDNFNQSPVKSVNIFKEGDDCDDAISKILKDFIVSKNKGDKVKNSELKKWCLDNNINMSKKLKPVLKQFGCEEYKIKSERGMKGLILNEVLSTTEVVEKKEENDYLYNTNNNL